MNSKDQRSSSRREFLTGEAARSEVERAGEALAEEINAASQPEAPSGGDTIRLGVRAMACDFDVVMNPGGSSQIAAASESLEIVHALEAQMSVYRADSELSRLNRMAASGPVEVEAQLFALLRECRRLSVETEGGFDPTSGPLISLWQKCRQQERIPTEDEMTQCLTRTGIAHVAFDDKSQTVKFDREGVELNLGGIGKGYALDRAGHHLQEQGVDSWLLHGGHSSLLARGDHQGLGGWPVGIRNPLFPNERLATVLLKDGALASSGSGVQHFRHGGKRYGHILDPRTGHPVEGMLSVTVLAETAAEADALSTAFFVIGVENTRRFCHNRVGVHALLIPPPRRGRRLEPVICGIPSEVLFFSHDEPPGANEDAGGRRA
jgi:thiamine biosynthesis lipoprotein